MLSLAYILVLTAMQSMPLALVAPLRETSIIVGSLLSYWLFVKIIWHAGLPVQWWC